MELPRPLAPALATVFCLFGAEVQASRKWEVIVFNEWLNIDQPSPIRKIARGVC